MNAFDGTYGKMSSEDSVKILRFLSSCFVSSYGSDKSAESAKHALEKIEKKLATVSGTADPKNSILPEIVRDRDFSKSSEKAIWKYVSQEFPDGKELPVSEAFSMGLRLGSVYAETGAGWVESANSDFGRPANSNGKYPTSWVVRQRFDNGSRAFGSF